MELHCNNCHCVFEEDDAGTYTEVERLSGRSTVRLTMLCCPYCGADDLSPATTEEHA